MKRAALGAVIAAVVLATSACASGGGASDGNAAQVARGEEIFQNKAGSLSAGCAFCHGPEGRGFLAPAIQGKSPDAIKKALESVPVMQPIKLPDEDIEAVAAYLKTLQSKG